MPRHNNGLFITGMSPSGIDPDLQFRMTIIRANINTRKVEIARQFGQEPQLQLRCSTHRQSIARALLQMDLPATVPRRERQSLNAVKDEIAQQIGEGDITVNPFLG